MAARKKRANKEAVEMIDNEIKTLESKAQLIQAMFSKAIGALKSIRATCDLVSFETLAKMVDEITTGVDFKDKDAEAENQDENGPYQRSYTGTVIERVRQYFVNTGNMPSTNAEIREAINTSRGTLAMVLYTTHPDEFDRVVFDGTHLIHWQLTASAWASYAPVAPGSGDGDNIPF